MGVSWVWHMGFGLACNPMLWRSHGLDILPHVGVPCEYLRRTLGLEGWLYPLLGHSVTVYAPR